MHGSIRLELGTMFFAGEKGLCSVFLKIAADIVFGRVLTQISSYYSIFVDFALIFLRRIGPLEKWVTCFNTT